MSEKYYEMAMEILSKKQAQTETDNPAESTADETQE